MKNKRYLSRLVRLDPISRVQDVTSQQEQQFICWDESTRQSESGNIFLATHPPQLALPQLVLS